jgi:hypothetical protein
VLITCSTVSQEVTKSVSSPAKEVDPGLADAETQESVNFADEVLLTPEDDVAVTVSIDASVDVENVGNDSDSDVTIGMSLAKRKRTKKFSNRAAKRNLNDVFEASLDKPLGSSKVSKK